MQSKDDFRRTIKFFGMDLSGTGSISIIPSKFSELLPLEDLAITPEDHGALIEWELTDLNEEQDAATHVSLALFNANNVSVWSEPTRISKSKVG